MPTSANPAIAFSSVKSLRVVIAGHHSGTWPGHVVRAFADYPAARDEGDRALWYHISGTYLDEFGAPGQRRVHVYSRVTGRLLVAADTSPATGAYSVVLPYTGEVKVTCQDDDAGTLTNDLVLRTFPIAP